MFANDYRIDISNANKCINSTNDLINTKKRRIGDESSNVMDIKESIITNFSQLYLSPKFSDITFKVENESIACHKSILGSQSDFFDRLFETRMRESTQSEVELRETDPKVFRLLLKLIYFGQIDLQDLKPTDVIKLFGLIQKYQFQKFEDQFLDKIKTIMNKSNIWPLFETSHETHLTVCLNLCFDYLNTQYNSESFFDSQDFLQISIDSLQTLLSRDSLLIPEIQLFLATNQWLDRNGVALKQRQELIKCIRFTLIKYEDLINIVSKTGLVSEQELWNCLKDKAMIDNWDNGFVDTNRNRAFVVHSTDLCCDKFKFEVLKGRVNGLEAEDQFDQWNDSQIVAKFGFPFNINNIEMKMSDKRGDRFSYKIEYSIEGLNWKTLYDYTSYTTANFQKLFFDPIVAQLFRICGTHQLRMDSNTKTSFNSIETFGCYYNKRQLKVERIDGLLSNAYWIRNCVQQRVYHDSNSGAAVANSPMNGKYYSRLLSSNKPIIVALDQPVMIDSFQFLLWDRDERAYSYVVEAKDRNEWIKLSDKSSEICRSWQQISFNRRPISLVRVKGIQIHFVDCNEFRIIKFNFPKTC